MQPSRQGLCGAMVQPDGCQDCQNWELWTAVEKEKTRLRGVLEAVGPAGWHGFVAWPLSNSKHQVAWNLDTFQTTTCNCGRYAMHFQRL